MVRPEKKKKKSHIEKRLVVAKGEGGGRMMDWEFGISRCKLVYTGWINNKVLLCSTGNYIQYPVKKNVYICISESLCCTEVINTS